MKQSEIQIGRIYAAKVSGSLAPIRIIGTFGWRSGRVHRDGFVGVNLRTGRTLRFRSAQRFRAEVTEPTQP
jgi:hypothetical protein